MSQRLLVIGSLVILTAFPLNGRDADISMELTFDRREYLPFERLEPRLVIRNLRGEAVRVSDTPAIDGHIEVRAAGQAWHECPGNRLFPFRRGASFRELKPRETAVMRFGFRACGMSEPGQYELRYLYDMRAELNPANDPRVFIGTLASEPFRLTIAQPVGEDAEVLRVLGPYPQNKRDKLLEMFPTSTYTGEVLVEQRRGTNPEDDIGRRAMFTKNEGQGQHTVVDLQNYETRRRAECEERIAVLRKFLTARPDFAYANTMRVELAGQLASLDRYTDAEDVLRNVVKAAPESDEGTKARSFLKFLADKGWIKSAEGVAK